MQHLVSNYREEDVGNEAETKDLLHGIPESGDVGSLAEGRFAAYYADGYPELSCYFPFAPEQT